MMKRGGTLVLLLVLLAAPVLAVAEERVDTHRPAAPDGRVEIESMAGTIRVVGWEKDEVAVTGTVGEGAEGLSFHGTARRTRIGVDYRSNPQRVISHLEVHVPAGSDVSVSTYAAEVTAADLTGTFKADSVNGSIAVSGRPREVTVESVMGSIEVAGLAPGGRLHAESVNGSVNLKGASGDLDASTVAGHLSAQGGDFQHCKLESVSGSIAFDGSLASHGALEAETVSGSVGLLLPGDLGADFSVSSFSGRIENELGPPARRTSRYTSEKELTFTTGSGGSRIVVTTLSGHIALRRKP